MFTSVSLGDRNKWFYNAIIWQNFPLLNFFLFELPRRSNIFLLFTFLLCWNLKEAMMIQMELLQDCVAPRPLLCPLLAPKWWWKLWYVCPSFCSPWPFSPFRLNWISLVFFFFKLCRGAVVLFRSREHENCGPQPGFVRAHIESNLQIVFFFMIQTEKKFLYSLSFSFFLSYLLTIIYMSSILE